ncbi:MAG TPA: glycosyltransferase family 2 protein [Steroidobacteraceae bacterium]|nr:glycosyltransferase family 2 protein [Steroidobacteraceae bacterium]
MASHSSLPKVSIVTVCFNSAATIRDTIESILSQDYPAIEHLIIDGGSTDRTLDIVRSYGERIAVVVSEPDRGIYDAMNKGIRLASGAVIGTLNSDDAYTDPRAVSDLVDALQRSGADCVFADLVYVDRDDPARVRRYYDSGKWSPARLRFGWMPAHPTLFVKRAWYERCGPYSLEYRIAADYEMIVRLLHVARARYAHVPRPVVRMRIGGISTQGLRHSLLLNREIVRACRAHGIWTALPLVLMKLPAKLIERIRVPRGARA